VYVRCFGEFEVLGGGRPLVAARDGAGSGPWQAREVLAFMAAQPDGVAMKEQLLNALWGDDAADRGGRRLTVALVRVREWLLEEVPGLRATGSLIVRCHRDGICRLDPDAVSSDVQEFAAALQQAAGLPPEDAKRAYARALALYRGDLLTRPAFGWVEERGETGVTLREELRERYRRATLELARLHQESGDARLAVPLYQSLLRAEPGLEDVVRLLYRCYHRLGDRSALVLEDRRLRQALKEMLSDPDAPDDDPELYAPQPETVALFDRLLADLNARSRGATVGSAATGDA
jgi:DNA-binding SARP family transcriptional activator